MVFILFSYALSHSINLDKKDLDWPPKHPSLPHNTTHRKDIVL